jgi:hypothetical protein
MSAERGWIGEPQPTREWHMPGWVRTGGRHFVQPSQGRRARGQFQEQAAEARRKGIPLPSDDPARQEEIRHAEQRVAEHEVAETKRADMP